jgi:hypothetical protein
MELSTSFVIAVGSAYGAWFVITVGSAYRAGILKVQLSLGCETTLAECTSSSLAPSLVTIECSTVVFHVYCMQHTVCADYFPCHGNECMLLPLLMMMMLLPLLLLLPQAYRCPPLTPLLVPLLAAVWLRAAHRQSTGGCTPRCLQAGE